MASNYIWRATCLHSKLLYLPCHVWRWSMSNANHCHEMCAQSITQGSFYVGQSWRKWHNSRKKIPCVTHGKDFMLPFPWSSDTWEELCLLHHGLATHGVRKMPKIMHNTRSYIGKELRYLPQTIYYAYESHLHFFRHHQRHTLFLLHI